MKLTASTTDELQSSLDGLAANGGGTLLLEPGATYEGVSLRMPFNSGYDNIRIIGNHTRLIAPPNAPKDWKLLWVGGGWTQWDQQRVEGVEVSGVQFVGGQVFLDFTDEASVQDCKFTDSPIEALVTGGAAVNTDVYQCRAKNCGKQWAAGGLAAFNLCGTYESLIKCIAVDCGAGAEIGGTSFIAWSCYFKDAPIKIGSKGSGCSDICFIRSMFKRSAFEIGNGIGKMSDIRIVDNTLADSPICWNGAATTNRVNQPGLPWFDHVSVISGNHFIGRLTEWQGSAIGQGIRLTAGDPNVPQMPLRVESNRFDIKQPGWSVICQGYVQNQISFVDNLFPQDVGRIYTSTNTSQPLPDPTPMLKWERNRIASDAYLLVNDGSKEWKAVIQ